MTKLWIEDRILPTQRDWLLDRLQQQTEDYKDYAIVACFTAPDTDQLSVGAAGIGRGGTVAARVNFWSMNITWARCSDNFHPIGRRRTLKWFLRPRSFKAVLGHRTSTRYTPGSDFAANIGGPFHVPLFSYPLDFVPFGERMRDVTEVRRFVDDGRVEHHPEVLVEPTPIISPYSCHL